jgi:hypothetical protein
VNHFGAYTFHTCEDNLGSKMKRRNELPRSVVRVCNSPDPLITPLKFPLKRPISPNSVAILIAELWNCCFHDVIMPGHHADYFPPETECWIGRAHCFVDCGKEIAPFDTNTFGQRAGEVIARRHQIRIGQNPTHENGRLQNSKAATKVRSLNRLSSGRASLLMALRTILTPFPRHSATSMLRSTTVETKGF